jgi:hypothetical protein
MRLPVSVIATAMAIVSGACSGLEEPDDASLARDSGLDGPDDASLARDEACSGMGYESGTCLYPIHPGLSDMLTFPPVDAAEGEWSGVANETGNPGDARVHVLLADGTDVALETALTPEVFTVALGTRVRIVPPLAGTTGTVEVRRVGDDSLVWARALTAGALVPDAAVLALHGSTYSLGAQVCARSAGSGFACFYVAGQRTILVGEGPDAIEVSAAGTGVPAGTAYGTYSIAPIAADPFPCGACTIGTTMQFAVEILGPVE